MSNAIEGVMGVSREKIREMVDVNTIIGDPIVVDNITLLPVSKVSFGLATGGSDFPSKTQTGLFGGGGGAGVRVEPVGFLIIKDGNIRMLNVTPPANTTLDRAIEILPSMVDRVDEFIDKRTAEKE